LARSSARGAFDPNLELRVPVSPGLLVLMLEQLAVLRGSLGFGAGQWCVRILPLLRNRVPSTQLDI